MNKMKKMNSKTKSKINNNLPFDESEDASSLDDHESCDSRPNKNGAASTAATPQSQHPQQPPILVPLLIDKLLSLVYGTAKTSSKTLSSLLSYLIRHFLSKPPFQTPTCQHRIQDWTRVGKAWYNTLSLWFFFPVSESSQKDQTPSPSPSSSYQKKKSLLVSDVQLLFDTLIDVGTSTNTQSLILEMSRFFLLFIQVLKSEEMKSVFSHVPILYTHLVDLFASGQAKQYIHVLTQQVLPHGIECLTDEASIHSLAQVIAYTLQSLAMEQLYHQQQQQQQPSVVLKNKNRRRRRRKAHTQALMDNLLLLLPTSTTTNRTREDERGPTIHTTRTPSTSITQNHLYSREKKKNTTLEQRAQRRHVRNQWIQSSSRPTFPSLDLEPEDDDEEEEVEGGKEKRQSVDNHTQSSPSIPFETHPPLHPIQQDYVSSLGGDVSVSMVLEPTTTDWIHRLGDLSKTKNNTDIQESLLDPITTDSTRRIPNPVICIPMNQNNDNIQESHMEELETSFFFKDPGTADIQDTIHAKNQHPLVLEQEDEDEEVMSDIESLKLDRGSNPNPKWGETQTQQEEKVLIHIKASSSVLPAFEQSLETIQTQIKSEQLDSLLQEESNGSSHPSQRQSSRRNRPKPKYWYPKSAAAAGCGDEYGQEALRNLFQHVAVSNHSQNPRIFRPMHRIYPRRDTTTRIENEKKALPILTVVWDSLSYRHKMILYFLMANVILFLILFLLLGTYAIYLLLIKILR